MSFQKFKLRGILATGIDRLRNELGLLGFGGGTGTHFVGICISAHPNGFGILFGSIKISICFQFDGAFLANRGELDCFAFALGDCDLGPAFALGNQLLTLGVFCLLVDRYIEDFGARHIDSPDFGGANKVCRDHRVHVLARRQQLIKLHFAGFRPYYRDSRSTQGLIDILNAVDRGRSINHTIKNGRVEKNFDVIFRDHRNSLVRQLAFKDRYLVRNSIDKRDNIT